MKQLGIVFLLAVGLLTTVSGQTFDSSGNGLLQGNYYFREVVWLIGDNSGDLGEAVSVYGTINFDGNGNYALNAQIFELPNSGVVQAFTFNGTYKISASGYGLMDSPVSQGDSVYGLVSNGIFVGSSTESGFNDLFIAAKLASPIPANSSFKGSYTMMNVDFPTGIPTDTRDSQFQLNADGNGNITNVSAAGYVASSGSSVITDNIGNIKYFFSNGGANVNFGTSSNRVFIAGTEYLYFSADGNFVFGGSPTGFDMIIGVRNNGGATSFNGLYYQAGVVQDESTLASAFADLDTSYGSLNANNGVILGAQRFLSLFNNNPIDFSYSGTYTMNADGTADDASNHYVFTNNGAIRIGMGKFPSIGVNVAVQAPSFSAGGVFINPTGVVNAGSSAPFTAGVARGELLSIFGTNLAPSLKVDSTFPTTLNGVQVLVNNRPTPIYFVSQGQISAVVPFGTSESVANIQVINNGSSSNTVSSYVNMTAPGIFTNPVGGLGSAAALHPDFSLVNSAHPAQIGETVAIYLTGLGDVSPAVNDGAPGPTNPLSFATNAFSVLVDGQAATPTFAGLAPGLVGLYQINVTIPAGVSAGNVSLAISGPDYFTSEATIPVGGISALAPPSTERLAKPLSIRKGSAARARIHGRLHPPSN